jgi:hypothetical protein
VASDPRSSGVTCANGGHFASARRQRLDGLGQDLAFLSVHEKLHGIGNLVTDLCRFSSPLYYSPSTGPLTAHHAVRHHRSLHRGQGQVMR